MRQIYSVLILGLLVSLGQWASATAVPTASAGVREAQNLVQQLGGAVAVPADLTNQQQLKVLTQKPRISFASSIKRFLSVSGQALAYDKDFEKPTVFNPQWDPEKVRAIQDERAATICDNMLSRFADKDKTYIQDMVDSLAKAQPHPTFVPDPREATQVAQLNTIVGTLPGNFGVIQHFDVVNNVITELHVSKLAANNTDTNTVSISIPFLVNIKVDKDQQYVNALSCLTDYFTKQNDVLQIRQREIVDASFASKIHAREQQIDQMYAAYQVSLNGQKGEDKTSFRQDRLLEDPSDPIDIYLLRKTQYALRPDEIPNGRSERDANGIRIGALQKAIPAIKLRLAGAQYGHSQMELLSATQLNKLLRLMIQLRGDLPTAQEVQGLKMQAINTGNDVATANYVQDSVLENALSDLQMSFFQVR